MKKERILLFGDEVLRQKAEPVKVFHKKLQGTVDRIKITLKSTRDAAALAANQIGLLKRITVIDYCDEYIEMINPEILESDGEVTEYEGCLSLPGFSGMVKRAETVKVKFQDRKGKEILIERSGMMARCIQHEIDHLDGVLYIDRMEEEFVYNDDDGTKMVVSDLLSMTDRKNG